MAPFAILEIVNGADECYMSRKSGGANLCNGGEKMSVSRQGAASAVRCVWVPELIGLAFLVCALFFGGCGKTTEIAITPEEERKAELLRSIDRRFDNPEAHYELGQMYQADGLWIQAESSFNTALRFNPGHRPAQAAMVKVLLESGNKARGELYADIYMNQVGSSAAGSLGLGLAFQKQHLDEYALSCYRQAQHLAPNSAKVQRQIGYYYLSKNDKVRAKEYLMRSFQLDRGQPEVAGELGRLGVAVEIPRRIETDTEKLDKIVEEAEK
jgi:tetratricopeptide (TPR) repeat protein